MRLLLFFVFLHLLSDSFDRWVKVTVAVEKDGEEAAAGPRLATDTEVLTVEQTGRLTG